MTGTGSTNITNRNINQASTPSTGLKFWFQDNPTYVQANTTIGAAAGNIPAAGGANGATPTTSVGALTAMTNSAQLWDNASVSTGSAARNGDFVVFILGVDFSYVGGAGTAIALPNILLVYDEA